MRMDRKMIEIENLDLKDCTAKPVISALLYQLKTLRIDCPEEERETTKTWDVMYFSLKYMISSYVFETKPNGQDESNLEKMFVLITENEISVETASQILSNWKQLDRFALDYWINKNFVSS